MLKRLRVCLNLVIRREEGNVIILVALMAFLLVIVVGVAIDMVRAQTLRARMQYALDAGGLAAAGTIFEVPNGMGLNDWAQSQATRYFDADFPTGYLQSAPVILTAQVINPGWITTLGMVVNLSANTMVATDFMQLFGFHSMAVGTQSVVKLRVSGPMELAFVLDNSTPMNQPVNAQESTPRISYVQDELSNFENALFAGDGHFNIPGLFISVVPFAGTENIGTGYPGWMDPHDP